MAGRSGSMASRVLLWIVAHSTWCLPRYRSIKSFFDLRRDFQSERVQALREIADILQKLIVKDHRWNGGEETRRGGDQRLGDARCHGAHFVRGGELHADGDGLQALQLGWMRIARGAADLALQLAVACGIDRRKWGAGRCQGLRIRHAPRGAKDAQKLVALAADPSEEAKLLENHGPGNDRE